jgi:hypothetical protein
VPTVSDCDLNRSMKHTKDCVSRGIFHTLNVQTDRASRLVNMETTQNLEKIKSCRTLFRIAILVAIFLIMLSVLFAVVCLSEGGAKLSLVWLALGIYGSWGIYIFVREGTILPCLIATIATTIFSKKSVTGAPYSYRLWTGVGS